MSLYQYLSHLAGIKVKLQKASLDIVASHDMITKVKMIYKEEREGFPKYFDQSKNGRESRCRSQHAAHCSNTTTQKQSRSIVPTRLLQDAANLQAQ